MNKENEKEEKNEKEETEKKSKTKTWLGLSWKIWVGILLALVLVYFAYSKGYLPFMGNGGSSVTSPSSEDLSLYRCSPSLHNELSSLSSN